MQIQTGQMLTFDYDRDAKIINLEALTSLTYIY